jgi:cytochrome c-type biogenesis protein CcmH/NrfF
MRSELASFIDEGKSHDEIIQAFVTKYDSQEMLGAPIDKGFNRLAWLFPYLLGAGGVVAIGFAAVRWTRKDDVVPASPRELTDAALDDRLDDELRDLD